MARSEGSLCSTEAKNYATEIAQLSGLPYKQNLDYLRFIEKLLTYRITEQVREHTLKETDLPIVEIEIPLIGNLVIKPVVFHKSHRLTDKPSLHFEYEFEPLSGFKQHLINAYTSKECELPTEFAKEYGQKLIEIYEGD